MKSSVYINGVLIGDARAAKRPIGINETVTDNYQHFIGTRGFKVHGNYNTVEGEADFSVTGDYNHITKGAGVVVVGNYNEVHSTESIVRGDYNQIFGRNNQAVGKYIQMARVQGRQNAEKSLQ